MTLSVILLLIGSGILVGFINTFAGGAAAISIAVYTALGLPINVANGTNRLPVLFQTLVASVNFRKQGLLNYTTGLKLSIPTVIGSIAGAMFASKVNPSLFIILLASVLMLMLLLLLFSPKRLFHSTHAVRPIRWSDYCWFFVVGLYGGAFHVGMGYIILAVTIMAMGYDMLTANALKNFIVLLYIPFPLIIFMFHGQVAYGYGLVHAVGNVIGSFLASHYATRIRSGWIRWSLVALILITVLDLLKIIDIQHSLHTLTTL